MINAVYIIAGIIIYVQAFFICIGDYAYNGVLHRYTGIDIFNNGGHIPNTVGMTCALFNTIYCNTDDDKDNDISWDEFREMMKVAYDDGNQY